MSGAAPRTDAAAAIPGWRHESAVLSARLPRLTAMARDVAASVMHGVHGRRRSGPGENFWQFRPFLSGEPAAGIDWRRSAREDRAFVREREWEAAHTLWIWIDRSPSMHFASDLASASKIDRAAVLGLAAADLLVRGGERVGLLGLTRALASRGIIERFAEAILVDERLGGASASAELPPTEPLKSRARAIILSDMLSEPAAVERAINALSAEGALGHVVMISDPIEESFPFRGHVEFAEMEGPARLRFGRAQSLRDDYLTRLARHREAIRAIVAARGWSLAMHRTDRPASEALLALRMRLEGATAGGP